MQICNVQHTSCGAEMAYMSVIVVSMKNYLAGIFPVTIVNCLFKMTLFILIVKCKI